MAPHVRRLALHTTDGLSLRSEQSCPDDPVASAVICHPHPLHGGTMFAPVVDALFTELSAIGVACVRFNFRGVGGSDGRHDYGQGEQLDTIAAIDHLADEHPELPVWAMGWSFGADVTLGVTHPRLAGWYAVAPPLKIIDPETMGAATDPRPKLLCVPEHDQFNPPDEARQAVASWVNAAVVVVPRADHFLAGGLATVTTHAKGLLGLDQ